jgi:hypothetical protein
MPTAWYDVTDQDLSTNILPRDIRLMRMPVLSEEQLAILKQIAWRLRGDDYVDSKKSRDELVRLGLIERFGTFNFISRAGVVVLDTLGLLKESGDVLD